MSAINLQSHSPSFTPRPDQQIMREWVDALRSGEFKQGGGVLRTTEGGYCCLGVLCEIGARRGIISKSARASYARAMSATLSGPWQEKLDELGGAYMYDGNPMMPGERAITWAGLPYSQEFGYSTEVGGVSMRTLSSLNDTGASFAEIADIIEKAWGAAPKPSLLIVKAPTKAELIELPVMPDVVIPDSPAELTVKELIDA